MAITTSVFDSAQTTEALVNTYLGGDEHTNEEAVHNAATDIDAVKFNKHCRSIAEVAKRLRPGNIVPVYFELAAVVQAATTPVPILGSALTKWLPFKDCTLVGLTAQLGSALTAGKVTVQPQIGGVNTTFSLDVESTDQAGRAYQLPAAAEAIGETNTDVLNASDLLAGDDGYLEIDAIGDATFAVAASALIHVVAFLSIGEEESI